MATTTVKGSRRVMKYYNQWGEFLNVEIPKLTKAQAEWGKHYAITIAPEQTQALINAIDTRKQTKGAEYSIVSRTPRGNNKRNIPYHLFLHMGKRGGYKGSVKSGDHQYMDTTAEVIDDKYFEKVNNAVNKQLKK